MDFKIAADGDCSYEVKRCLLLGRKYDRPRQYIKNQKHHFANKGPSSQGYGFSSSHILECESWTIKQAEHQRIDVLNRGAGEDS